jgi:hypothetical protein
MVSFLPGIFSLLWVLSRLRFSLIHTQATMPTAPLPSSHHHGQHKQLLSCLAHDTNGYCTPKSTVGGGRVCIAREQASSTDTLTVGWLAFNGYPFWSRFAMEQNVTNARNLL